MKQRKKITSFLLLLLLLFLSVSMASSSLSSMIFGTLLFLAFLFSCVHSLNCSTEKPPANKVFANCTDLPTLGAILRYTYNESNSSLSIAYAAAPSNPNGWVAWAINPTGEGMAGAQTLLAFKSKDSVVVKTYNISSYKSIVESKLSFDVWGQSAEESKGVITIFATVKVPTKVEKLNMVWQVGPSVTDGRPEKHEFKPANLGSKSTLSVESVKVENQTGTAKNDAVSVMRERFGLGFCVGLFMFLISCVNF